MPWSATQLTWFHWRTSNNPRSIPLAACSSIQKTTGSAACKWSLRCQQRTDCWKSACCCARACMDKNAWQWLRLPVTTRVEGMLTVHSHIMSHLQSHLTHCMSTSKLGTNIYSSTFLRAVRTERQYPTKLQPLLRPLSFGNSLVHLQEVLKCSLFCWLAFDQKPTQNTLQIDFAPLCVV